MRLKTQLEFNGVEFTVTAFTIRLNIEIQLIYNIIYYLLQIFY